MIGILISILFGRPQNLLYYTIALLPSVMWIILLTSSLPISHTKLNPPTLDFLFLSLRLTSGECTIIEIFMSIWYKQLTSWFMYETHFFSIVYFNFKCAMISCVHFFNYLFEENQVVSSLFNYSFHRPTTTSTTQYCSYGVTLIVIEHMNINTYKTKFHINWSNTLISNS